MKRIFVIGGLSESGKSSIGRYLDSKGIVRWKFITFYKKIMRKINPTADFNEWQNQTIKKRPGWLWQQFIEALKEKMEKENIAYCVLESLYDPSLTKALRVEFNDKILVLYVDIPEEIRLQRQIIRQNLKSVQEAKDYLLPRDKDKVKWGALEIKNLANVVIDNSGSLNDLYHQLDELIKQFCPELNKE